MQEGLHRGADTLKRDALQHKASHQAPLPSRGTPAHLRYATEELRRLDSRRKHLQDLQDQANYLQGFGEQDDTILAHINPEEAEELSEEHGGTINPYTGLPQFGFWQNLRKNKFLSRAIPIASAIVGNLLLPGAGGILGGALGGAATHKNPLKGGAMGAGTGALTGIGSSILGSSGLLGKGALSALAPIAGTPGILGPATGMFGNIVSPVNSIMGGIGNFAGKPLGMLGAPIVSGFQKGYAGPQQPQMPQQTQQQPVQQMPQQQQPPQEQPGFGQQFLSGLGSGVGSLVGGVAQHPLQSILGGLSLYGALREGKHARKHAQSEHERMLAHNPYANAYRPPEEYQETVRVRPKRRRILKPGDVGYDPMHKYYEDTEATEYYAAGGHATGRSGGYIGGDSGGQDDDHDAHLEPGDFIEDATTVSLVGDGNSAAGKKKINEFLHQKANEHKEDKFARGAIVRDYPYQSSGKKVIKAKLSSGEMRIPASVVTAVGKGSNQKGAKVLDIMRRNIRKHKGVKTFLPPKSKKLESYIR